MNYKLLINACTVLVLYTTVHFGWDYICKFGTELLIGAGLVFCILSK